MNNRDAYRAWLQNIIPAPMAMRLDAPGDIPEWIRREATRLGEWRGDAFFAVSLSIDPALPPQSFRLTGDADGLSLSVAGADGAGLLYGVYAFHDRLRLGESLAGLELTGAPAVPARVLNHWDNVDGTVERGYAGRSLFFDGGSLCYDEARITDYARLLASVGINAVCLNNVNVTPAAALLITEARLPELAKLAALFRPFYIRLIIAVDFTSPRLLGGVATPDPLDAAVAAWWARQADIVYSHIPDLAGFLVKADSEFRDGPAALGRTQADGANVVARALAPHGGTVYWRCFVYNCQQDWRDAKTDRPKAAYDHFYPLDGDFDANVALQIKNGPSDFQVREPVSPLLGAMKHTRQALELQVTQEYTGQQIDLYALAVQWEEVLASRVSEKRRVSDLIGREVDAVCGVANTGLDTNWTGHTLAQANLYAFGRMAWNPGAKARDILESWTRLTFGSDPALVGPLTDMLARSRGVYEKYNAPLGIGWMVNIHHHYGPSVDGYEYMKWGTYHRASHTAIGVDRTQSGTGYTAQYDPWLAAIYDDPASCPEETLLYFHRLPFNYVLKSGKTIIQHIYDTHFEGVADVEDFIKIWASLQPLVPEEIHAHVAARLARQLENAREWRDVLNTYFHRLTAVPDQHGRKIYE